MVFGEWLSSGKQRFVLIQPASPSMESQLYTFRQAYRKLPLLKLAHVLHRCPHLPAAQTYRYGCWQFTLVPCLYVLVMYTGVLSVGASDVHWYPVCRCCSCTLVPCL